MANVTGTSSRADSAAGPTATPVGEQDRHEAVGRLIGATSDAAGSAAVAEFFRQAKLEGTDLTRLWCTRLGDGRLAQVALAAPNAGRTVSVFVSHTENPPASRGATEEVPGGTVLGTVGGVAPSFGVLAHRAAVLRAATEAFTPPAGEPRVMAQALLEPRDRSVAAAYSAAGYWRLAELSYLRRSVGRGRVEPANWPEGVEVRRVSDLPAGERDDVLSRVLEASYERTLDCPELCGLRATEDVLASHRAVGRLDERLWWVLFDRGTAQGCMLLSPVAGGAGGGGGGGSGSEFGADGERREEAARAWSDSRPTDTVELVYLGLAPTARGRGLGGLLLKHAMAELRGRKETAFTCAVDTRNEPALAVYRRLGMKSFATRVAYVRVLGSAGVDNASGGASG